MAKRSKQDLYNPEYDIGGLGPHTNSTYGYFQYLVADDIKLDNEAYLNKGTVANNFLVKGRIKATEVEIGTFASDDIDDSEFTGTCRMSDLCSAVAQLKIAVAELRAN
jgi:hypothetical protein